MLKKILLFSFSLFLFFLSSCANNQYENAKKLYSQKNYAPAIEEFDLFIKRSDNRFEILEAEIMRSEAYYELGMLAFEKKNYNLAIRLFYLSNTDKSDKMIVSSYEIIIDQYLEKNEKQRVLACYNYLIHYFFLSEKTKEFSYLRIKSILEWENNEEKAWEYFCIMAEQFPEDEYTIKSELLINPYLEKKLNLIMTNKDSQKSLFSVIDELNIIKQFSKTYKQTIEHNIASLYLEIADNFVSQNNIPLALTYYQEAVNSDSQFNVIVNKKREELCHIFIQKGNDLLNNEEIDLAIQEYQKSFQIISHYHLAEERIAFAEKIRNDIKNSEKLYQQGLLEERKNNYKEALTYYENAYSLRKNDTISQKIFEIKNIIQLESDPKAFAFQVLKEYKKGLLVNKISSLQKDLLSKWNKDLKDSGWKIIGSPTRFKVEIRYDLITPSNNYFFSWQINLKEKTIIPLNKLSEKLMSE